MANQLSPGSSLPAAAAAAAAAPAAVVEERQQHLAFLEVRGRAEAHASRLGHVHEARYGPRDGQSVAVRQQPRPELALAQVVVPPTAAAAAAAAAALGCCSASGRVGEGAVDDGREALLLLVLLVVLVPPAALGLVQGVLRIVAGLLGVARPSAAGLLEEPREGLRRRDAEGAEQLPEARAREAAAVVGVEAVDERHLDLHGAPAAAAAAPAPAQAAGEARDELALVEHAAAVLVEGVEQPPDERRRQ
jgi:hypothetical protein